MLFLRQCIEQRDQATHVDDFKGVGHFEAKFLVEWLTFRANVYGMLDGGMVKHVNARPGRHATMNSHWDTYTAQV